MTRKKKGRRVGSEGSAQYTEKKLTKQDIAALARKKQKKRKGLQVGSRYSQSSAELQKLGSATKDPRVGSKKAVPLIVENVPHPKSNQAKRQRRLDAQQELTQLENDIQLNVLLDRLENGERLGIGLQAYVDEKIDRIEQLMRQLGLLEEEPKTEPEKAKLSKDEELLARFEQYRFDED